MHTNIDAFVGISSFENIFQAFPDKIPQGYPQELFLKILKIVMENNIFAFGDTFWKQLSGAAMGTSCACMYATLT